LDRWVEVCQVDDGEAGCAGCGGLEEAVQDTVADWKRRYGGIIELSSC
jgi:predicted Fe-S protein YdhL (DUF1289 family)